MKTACEFGRELIKKTVPLMSYNGGDVTEWQKKAREKLSELIGLNKFEKCDPEIRIEYIKNTDGVTETRFTFQSEEGYRVPCHLLVPNGVERPPVMITLQGHSKGMHVSLRRAKYPGETDDTVAAGDRDFAVRAVKEGFAAVALEQRNFGECGGNENGPQCYEASMDALLIGRTTIGERVWDVMRLTDLLETAFADRIDPSRICLMGNSGGGTATAYTAAIDKRLFLAMPSCAVSSFIDSIGAMGHCCCNYVPRIMEYFDMGDLICMAAPMAYIQVNGKDDSIFPVVPAKEMFAQGRRAYEALGVPEKLIHVIGNGDHRFYADDSWPFVHQLTGR